MYFYNKKPHLIGFLEFECVKNRIKRSSQVESNGIKSFIIADDIGKMYPAASIYWGVKLFVNDKDFELADNLIEESSNDAFN